jgi:hypothetical protein
MALVLDSDRDGIRIINGEFITFPREQKGAEASERGFLTMYIQKVGKWEAKLLDESSIRELI